MPETNQNLGNVGKFRPFGPSMLTGDGGLQSCNQRGRACTTVLFYFTYLVRSQSRWLCLYSRWLGAGAPPFDRKTGIEKRASLKLEKRGTTTKHFFTRHHRRRPVAESDFGPSTLSTESLSKDAHREETNAGLAGTFRTSYRQFSSSGEKSPTIFILGMRL